MDYEKAVKMLHDRVEDIVRVEIPLAEIRFRSRGELLRGRGIVVKFVDSHSKVIAPDVAEQLINHGVLQRLNISVSMALPGE